MLNQFLVVREQCRCAAGMQKNYRLIGGDSPLSDVINQAGEPLTCVGGVEEDSLCLRY